MGYMVPLRFIRVGIKRTDNNQMDTAICATRIVAIMSIEISQARKTLQAEKKAGTLINASGLAPTKSVIFLDNGSVIASPLTVRRLMTLIERSNTKAGSVSKQRKLRVYDVYDEDPEESDEYENDAASAGLDIEYEDHDKLLEELDSDDAGELEDY